MKLARKSRIECFPLSILYINVVIGGKSLLGRSMRKSILVLPVAAVVLAAGVLLANAQGLFAGAGVSVPVAQVRATNDAQKSLPVGTDWQETSKQNVSKNK